MILVPQGNLETEEHQSCLAQGHLSLYSAVEHRNFVGEDGMTSEVKYYTK